MAKPSPKQEPKSVEVLRSPSGERLSYLTPTKAPYEFNIDLIFEIFVVLLRAVRVLCVLNL